MATTTRALDAGRLASIVLSLSAWACGSGSAPDAPAPSFTAVTPTVALSGTITHAGTGQPVSGAVVSIGSQSATTNSSGSYRLDGVASGNQNVRTATPGFATRIDAVTLAAAGVTTFSTTVVPRVLRGSFEGRYTIVFRQKASGFSCTSERTIAGTATVTLDQSSPTTSGTADLSGTQATVSSTCQFGTIGSTPFSGQALTLSGVPGNVGFTQEVRSRTPGGNGDLFDRVFTRTFAGAITGGGLSGRITFTERHESANELGEASVEMTLTLN